MRAAREWGPGPLSSEGTAGDAALWGGSSAAVGMAANPFGAHQAGIGIAGRITVAFFGSVWTIGRATIGRILRASEIVARPQRNRMLDYIRWESIDWWYPIIALYLNINCTILRG